MSIDNNLIKAYRANIDMGIQQKMSRLRKLVRVETQSSESEFYDRVGTIATQELTTRNAETTYQEIAHDRRMVTMSPAFNATLISKKDKLRMIEDPTSVYIQTQVASIGRHIDDKIITAAFDTVFTGKEGRTSKTFAADNGQTIAHGSKNLTLAKLRKARLLLARQEVGLDSPADLVIVVDPAQIEGLLSLDKIGSADYAAVKALVNGEINSFMGFEFIISNRLKSAGAGTGTGYFLNRCIVFTRDALLLAVGADVTARVDELPGRHYSNQVYASIDVGATRMWGEKVVEVVCDGGAAATD